MAILYIGDDKITPAFVSSEIKYGTTVNDFMGNTTEDGELLPPNSIDAVVFDGVKTITEQSGLVAFLPICAPKTLSFPDLTTVGDSALYNLSREKDFVQNFSAPNIVSVGENGLRSVFSLAGPLTVDATFDSLENVSTYGMASAFSSLAARRTTINNFSMNALTTVGSNGLQGCFSRSEFVGNTDIAFPGITAIDKNGAFSLMFKGTNITSLSFPNLESVTADNVFNSLTNDVASLVSINFPKLKVVDAGSILSMCDGTGLTSVSFPALETITDNYKTGSSVTITRTFYSCAALTSAAFPKLTSAGSLAQMFSGCTSLTSVSFPLLASVGEGAFQYTFRGCTSLTSVSFPSLIDVPVNAFNGTSTTSPTPCFTDSGVTEIHFRADAQEMIEATTGYDTKWGATNATIIFDL